MILGFVFGFVMGFLLGGIVAAEIIGGGSDQ